jgi:hypothetical protein
MPTKSRVRKKNGKPVKYKPKPKGLSKTQMKKLLKMIEDQQKATQENSGEVLETREGGGELLISPEFIKKLNVNPSASIEEGPALSEEDKTEEPVNESETLEEKEDENLKPGPISSEI